MSKEKVERLPDGSLVITWDFNEGGQSRANPLPARRSSCKPSTTGGWNGSHSRFLRLNRLLRDSEILQGIEVDIAADARHRQLEVSRCLLERSEALERQRLRNAYVHYLARR